MMMQSCPVRNRARRRRLFVALPCAVASFALCLLASAPAHAQIQVYFNNFDGTETLSSGAAGSFSGVTTTEGVQGFGGLGPAGNQFSGSFLRNQTTGNPAAPTVLTLTNLPGHTSIDVDFLLGVIDSWDGQQAPDIFNVTVDGTPVFTPSFAVASGTSNYTPPAGGDIGGGSQQRGFNGGFNDQAYNMYVEPSLNNISHSASTLTISWFASGAGWQGGADESWAIENVRVTLNGTAVAAPEPGTLGLAALGALPLAGGLWLRRRRRQAYSVRQ